MRSRAVRHAFFGHLDRKLGNQQNGSMKTTLDLPDVLMKQVKLRALQEGRKLKDAVADLLRKGLAAQAEIIACAPGLRGATVRYRFLAPGWEHPIVVAQRLPRDSKFAVGDKVAIRYLPAHPHISVIVPEAPRTPRKS